MFTVSIQLPTTVVFSKSVADIFGRLRKSIDDEPLVLISVHFDRYCARLWKLV